MISKETAYQQIQALVNRFDEQIESYRSGDYNETLTRRDFIDPFFKALGWDIDNTMVYQLYGLTPEEITMIENFR